MGFAAHSSSPKELSHREAPVLQHGAEQLGQVQPDVGNVDGHVVRLLQRICKPENTLRCSTCSELKLSENIILLF